MVLLTSHCYSTTGLFNDLCTIVKAYTITSIYGTVRDSTQNTLCGFPLNDPFLFRWLTSSLFLAWTCICRKKDCLPGLSISEPRSALYDSKSVLISPRKHHDTAQLSSTSGSTSCSNSSAPREGPEVPHPHLSQHCAKVCGTIPSRHFNKGNRR